jgi:hypothetical protein
MRITHIAPLTYTPGKLEYFQFIRGGVGADYHQSPTFHRFPSGRLLMYWHAYDYDECSSNGVSLYSVSDDRGLTWSDPQVYLADFPGGVPMVPKILGLRNRDTALMLYAQTRHTIQVDRQRRVRTAASDYFQSRTRLFIRRSDDGGEHFGPSEELPHALVSGGRELPGIGFYGSVDQVLELDSGRIVTACCFMDPARADADKGGAGQHYTVACLLSEDQGRTWTRGGEITVDTPRGVMEAQIVEIEPERLFCLFRTKGGYLYQTRSQDGGQTWNASQRSPLPAPESRARMIKLQSGSLLVVWNNVSSTTQEPRHPLAATISTDGGKTWSEPRIIADETGPNQLNNHSLIQIEDGRILLGISHYRAVRPQTSDLDVALFDEQWVQDG